MVPPAQKSKADVWAQLLLAEADCRRVGDFFTTEIGVHPKYVVRRMHLTVYHARRPMAGVFPLIERAAVALPAVGTRFMVMAPGGENARVDLEPGERKIGVRVHKQSSAMTGIQRYRERLLQYERRQCSARGRPVRTCRMRSAQETSSHT